MATGSYLTTNYTNSQSESPGDLHKVNERYHIRGVHVSSCVTWTATAGSDVVQSGRPSFDDFFQHLWPYIGNNTANVVFQMVKRLWLIRIDS
ncbi:hypothetical protein TNCV_1988401 [Trichonephila clavipes]|nr:hypothetical protein TNCV_1988401 [Trichonephila clavipes]